ncbi:hypothetical protein Tco_0348412 [Tanacetum coccineum]
MSSPLSPNLPPPPPLAHSPQFECITPLSSSFLPKCREEPSYSSVHTATLPLLPPLESNYSPTHAHIASLIPQIIYYLFGGMCNDWINVQLHLGLKLGFSNCLGLDILLRDAQAPSAPCTTFSLALTVKGVNGKSHGELCRAGVNPYYISEKGRYGGEKEWERWYWKNRSCGRMESGGKMGLRGRENAAMRVGEGTIELCVVGWKECAAEGGRGKT